MTLTTAGSGYTLGVSASGLAAVTTSPITVTPASPTQLAITEQPPSSVTAGSGFGLQALIEDAYGNLETGDDAAVTVALENSPGGATLGRTLSATASVGVAAFSGLTLTVAASGFSLQATSSGLTSATTNAITVTSSSDIVSGAAVAPDVYLAPLVLDSPDLRIIPGLKKRSV